jgi:hypothetical protein
MDEHKSHEQLQQEIAQAAKQVNIGIAYRHYKDPAKVYKVINFATQEADDELGVVYQAQYGPGLFFTRPLKEWTENVEWQGNTVPRFTPVA